MYFVHQSLPQATYLMLLSREPCRHEQANSKRKGLLLYGKHRSLAGKYLIQETPLPLCLLYLCSALCGYKGQELWGATALSSSDSLHDESSPTQLGTVCCGSKSVEGASGART